MPRLPRLMINGRQVNGFEPPINVPPEDVKPDVTTIDISPASPAHAWISVANWHLLRREGIVEDPLPVDAHTSESIHLHAGKAHLARDCGEACPIMPQVTEDAKSDPVPGPTPNPK